MDISDLHRTATGYNKSELASHMMKSLIAILSVAAVSAVQVETALRCKIGSECALGATATS